MPLPGLGRLISCMAFIDYSTPLMMVILLANSESASASWNAESPPPTFTVSVFQNIGPSQSEPTRWVKKTPSLWFSSPILKVI